MPPQWFKHLGLNGYKKSKHETQRELTLRFLEIVPPNFYLDYTVVVSTIIDFPLYFLHHPENWTPYKCV